MAEGVKDRAFGGDFLLGLVFTLFSNDRCVGRAPAVSYSNENNGGPRAEKDVKFMQAEVNEVAGVFSAVWRRFGSLGTL